MVNGGGWLTIRGRRVDFLYRDLEKVSRAVQDCRAGRITSHYQPGHPHGFHTHIYMGEVHHAKILRDASGALGRLAQATRPYPGALSRAVREAFLWESRFALETAEKSAARGDIVHAAGSFFRCVACLVQVLFAVNRRYFVNEKGSVDAVDSFATRPEGFARSVRAVLSSPGSTPEELEASLARLAATVRAVEELAVPAAG